jgi:hypothetical protein
MFATQCYSPILSNWRADSFLPSIVSSGKDSSYLATQNFRSAIFNREKKSEVPTEEGEEKQKDEKEEKSKEDRRTKCRNLGKEGRRGRGEEQRG